MKIERIAAIALAGLVLAGCADNLPCNEACTPEMKLVQEDRLSGALTVDLDYDDVFGKEWIAGVSVNGATATEHFGRPKTKEASK